MVHLKDLKNMITMNFTGTKLDGKSLKHLHGMQKLRIIYMYDVEIDQEDLDAIDAAISSLAIFN